MRNTSNLACYTAEIPNFYKAIRHILFDKVKDFLMIQPLLGPAHIERRVGISVAIAVSRRMR
jgi:hypothetical protein